MSNLQFAPGETNVAEESFWLSILFFWLKARMGVSSTRIVVRAPNTFLVIPVGSNQATYPLHNVAGVSVNTKFHVPRFILGLVLFIVSLALFASSVIAAVILLILSLAIISGSMRAALAIQNSGGSISYVQVSLLQKSKLQQFGEEINQRLFADHAALRHNESMQVQNQQLHVQQQQLSAQIMQQNALLQAMGQQQPQQANIPADPAKTVPSGQTIEPTQ